MIKFVAGLILGVSISAALAQGSVDDILREIGRAVRTPLPTMDNPILPRMDVDGYLNTGKSLSGKHTVILTDEDGKVICSESRP